MVKKPARTDLRGADADLLQIVALQSADPRRIRRVLDSRNPMRASLLPHVIPLLGDPAVAGMAMQALQLVADKQGGALVDALLDPSRTSVVRRRVARALSAGRSQVVADGLLLAMDDPQPDVRTQCARSLLRIQRKSAEIHVDGERVLDLVRAELTLPAPDLRHVCALLAFVVPVEPLRAAYRALRSDDVHARGTALEYLHGVLPKDVGVALLGKFED